MLLSRRRMGRTGTIAVVLAALVCALGVTAWVGDAEQAATAALPENSDIVAFNDRFLLTSPSASFGRSIFLQPLDHSALAAREMKFRDAKGLLAQQLSSQDWRSAAVDEPNVNETRINEARINESKASAGSASADIPLPRSRPVMANVEAPVPDVSEAPAGSALALADPAARQDSRTLWQKLSGLLPERIKLASLEPDGGLFRQGPDLAALGYDKLTAVYDISAKAVYLPNGSTLEAHSGMGSVRDDPEHVDRSMVGATPPAVYELKPREKLFHGVRALRMTPVDGTTTLGRSGLLAHSYMLGPNGDSNGCVSIKDYDRFRKAFDDGQVNRLVVVPSLSGTMSASQRAASQS
jgi:hypothetical protein